MEDREFEGKTTEEAVKNASRELKIPEEDLEIEILEPGSAGIFGLVGGKKAKIKVHLKQYEPEEKPEEDEIVDYEVAEETTEEVSEDDVSFARKTLSRILELIPLEASVSAEHGNGKIILLIEGDRSGLLIGRKGKTLDALQFIVNKIVNKALDRKISIVIDSENYRKRREEILTQMALRMGDKAKRIKKPVTTSPLNPHERRIIHLALKEDDRLDTKSRGDGLMKRVVIIPKR
ncbi:MAG: KH domain-containing protein [Desulfobacteraceae bacterium]|nr:MAG: KH domain-containing protein [Desulfobacteraceae bacterium]